MRGAMMDHCPSEEFAFQIAALTALAGVAALAAPTAAPTAGERYVAGSDGAGDPFFPLAGNGGYDVRSYFLDLDYDRGRNRLGGTVTVRAEATENLKAFNLDFRGYRIRRLEVDGDPARYSRDGQELTIRPRPRLARGRRSRSRSPTGAGRGRWWTPTTRSRGSCRSATAPTW